MKSFLIPVFLILVVALGYVFMMQRETPIVQNEDDAVMLSATFHCKDGTHFTAEFPEETAVRITDDNDWKILARVTGEGKRFEDENMVYIFAGEEATVITKSDTKTTTCEQPFSNENAPVNFGDAGEGGGEKQDAGLIVGESILGDWQLTDDPANDPVEGLTFYREFKKDGTYNDILEGDSIPDGRTVIPGTWKVFTKAKPIEVSFFLEEDIVYLQLITEDDNQKSNFKITKITPENLELSSLDRDGSLIFKSVK